MTTLAWESTGQDSEGMPDGDITRLIGTTSTWYNSSRMLPAIPSVCLMVKAECGAYVEHDCVGHYRSSSRISLLHLSSTHNLRTEVSEQYFSSRLADVDSEGSWEAVLTLGDSRIYLCGNGQLHRLEQVQ